MTEHRRWLSRRSAVLSKSSLCPATLDQRGPRMSPRGGLTLSNTARGAVASVRELLNEIHVSRRSELPILHPPRYRSTPARAPDSASEIGGGRRCPASGYPCGHRRGESE